MHLTARGYHPVLRVARTIADLDSLPQITRGHIADALSFRLAPDRRLEAECSCWRSARVVNQLTPLDDGMCDVSL